MYIAGIDIGGTNLKFGIFDENLECVHTATARTVRGDSQACARQISALIAAAPYKPELIGAGVPGTVFRSSGDVNSGNLKWSHVRFPETLSLETGLPVWIDNDAQCALAAETLSGGACYGIENALYLTLGTGVGGAILINGKPWRGHDNAGGELGHFVTHAGGFKCPCGLRGCFEMYASAGALSRYASGVRARQVIDGARSGNQKLMRALDDYAREVATGLCSLYMIFRPQVIVLGGGLSAGGEILIERVLRHISDSYNITPGIMQETLKLATRRNDAGMAGAALLARENLKY